MWPLIAYLVNVSGDRFTGDDIFGDAILINTHCSEDRQSARVDLGSPIRDDANND